MTAKKAPAPAANPVKPRALKSATLIHFIYQREAGVVNASVQQDVTVAGDTQRHGRDKSIAVADLGADIRKHLEAAFAGIAKKVGAAT